MKIKDLALEHCPRERLRRDGSAKIYQSKFSSLDKEHCMAVYLDTKNKIIKDEIISVGILNASLIHQREIFHGARKEVVFLFSCARLTLRLLEQMRHLHRSRSSVACAV